MAYIFEDVFLKELAQVSNLAQVSTKNLGMRLDEAHEQNGEKKPS